MGLRGEEVLGKLYGGFGESSGIVLKNIWRKYDKGDLIKINQITKGGDRLMA